MTAHRRQSLSEGPLRIQKDGFLKRCARMSLVRLGACKGSGQGCVIFTIAVQREDIFTIGVPRQDIFSNKYAVDSKREFLEGV